MAATAITRRAFSQALAVVGAAGGLQQPALAASLAGRSAAAGAAPDDLCDLGAVDLASRLRRKDVSAREVMAAHLARIERLNPKVNAIVTLVADRAIEEAARADAAAARGDELGVLHGLPVAHKDLVDTAGIRTTYG